MANMAQVIVTGVMGIPGAAVGSGLTYWLGALNRRHYEARQNATRFYDARLSAYVDLSRATFNGVAVAQRR